MKKCHTRFSSLLVLGVLYVSLLVSSCGESSTNPLTNPLVGTWTLSELIVLSAVFSDTLNPVDDTLSGDHGA